MENQRLRQMLGMKSFGETSAGSPLSPPISNSSSPMPQMSDASLSPPQMTIYEQQMPSVKTETDHKVVFIQRGLTPHSKFALCIFMVGVVCLNSFGSIILTDRPNMDMSDGNYNVETARRAILSTIDDVSFCRMQTDPFALFYVLLTFFSSLAALHNVFQLAKFGRVNGEFPDCDCMFDQTTGLW